MTETIGIILENVGAVLAIWGFFWMLWDHRATAPIWLMGTALVALLGGALLT